ncbi:MAG: type II toxin-antitoxin system RelE/ParE family toxin [Bacteroidales bacterium]|nr:type II toxin-antitoxin system RelE/ParE family toxin [Bacteroidales bacterium]
MIVVFAKTYLEELYESGRTSEKKYRFQPDIISRYRKRIGTLLNAPSPETLYQIHSLHFEALVGDKAGLYSIRVNDKYRIEFTIQDMPEHKSVTVCSIEELSKHYD